MQRVARETFGWEHLRTEQIAAITAVLQGHDVLAVLPTGAGKSAIYQVPAMLQDGLTLVVSPLIALQNDQIESLAGSRAPAAVAVNSTLTEAELDAAWEALRTGRARYVFLAPEQLAHDEVVESLAWLGVGLLAVDEAHCVSAWGHDFRPDYLRIGAAVDRLGRPTVLALTATAAPPVREDIAARLGLRGHREIVAGFDRPNLHLAVQRHVDAAGKRAAAAEWLAGRCGPDADGCGLAYAASRRQAEEVAADLAGRGLRVGTYHAGMRAADRERVHAGFAADAFDVVVATSAFGMGIDKPDVRCVLHASVPESLDTYYQQIGRAGRDGGPAEILLLFRPQDLALQRFLTAVRMPEDAVRAVAHRLSATAEPMTAAELRRAVDCAPARTTRALNLLEQTGAVGTRRRRLHWAEPDADVEAVVERAAGAAAAHERLVRSRLEMMRKYAETTGCRRQLLLGYFGQVLREPCGACDTCAAGTAERMPQVRHGLRVGQAVRHRTWGRGVVMALEDDRLTVLFDDAGYRTLALAAVREDGLLRAEK